MSRKVKRILTALLVVCLFLLTACADSPDQVKIASEKEIRAYAKQKYGAASSYEVSEGENSRTVTFTDREYGFTYTVESYAMELGIDGSTFGYAENKTSDFNQNYYKVLSDLAIDKFGYGYDAAYGYCTEYGYNFHVYNVNAYDAENVTEEIGKYLKKLDTRKFYSDSESRVMAYHGEEENYLGSWHLSDGKYYYYADENIEQMTYRAEAAINTAGSEKKNLHYLYWEQMDISEVPGIEDWELVNHTIDDGTIVTLYWFEIDGEKHFFADVKVWNIGDVYYSDTL